jgi:hypothetical protein
MPDLGCPLKCTDLHLAVSAANPQLDPPPLEYRFA